jgi:single-stranded DNA-binding protein
MNICAIAGHLPRNAVLKGTDKKVLLFTLAAKSGWDESEQKDRVSYVPCVIFNPSDDLVHSLVNNGKGIYVQLEGRVVSSSYEADGERKFSTEVMAFNRSITFVKH